MKGNDDYDMVPQSIQGTGHFTPMDIPPPPSPAHPKESESIEVTLDRVFMAGLGIAEADDIDPEEHDMAIINTRKHYLDEAAKALEALYNQRIEDAIGEDTDDRYEKTTHMPISIIRARLRQEIRTRAGINKKEDV